MKISRRTRWRRVTTSPSRNLLTVAAVLLAVLLPEALPLQAQEQQQQQETPPPQEGRQRHLVRPGDTLWDLAEFYLTDPFLWPEIYRLNTMVIEDPHWIYPDEQLVLPGPGEIVREVPGEELPGEGEVVVRPPEPEVPPGEVTLEGEELRTIFVDRKLERATLTYQRAPPPPPIAVSEYDFNRAGMLVPLDELGPHGEVIEPVGAKGSANIMGEFLEITRYSELYVSHPGGEAPELADRLLLLHRDRRVKGYGYVVVPTGMAVVVDVHEDVSTVVITEIYNPVSIGDWAVAAEPFDARPGVFAQPVATGPTAELIEFEVRNQPVPSVEDIIFIDIGRNQGVVIGDEFELYLPQRESAGGYKLPEAVIGRARVVRTTEETATLRVIRQRFPAIAVGLPVRLVAKMPS